MTEASEIIAVRHGETEFNIQGRYQGHADSPLTPGGIEQARRLAPRIVRLDHLRTIYCSDLGRARETARLLAEVSGDRIVEDAGLRERGYGVFEGQTRDEIADRYPAELAAARAHTDYAPPGGETPDQFLARIAEAFERLASQHAGHATIVVTHGGTVTAFARHVLGVPVNSPRRLDVDNTSLSRFLRRPDGTWIVRSLGDTAHLETQGG